MMRLMALIIAIFAVITTAWAWGILVDYPTCPDDGKAYEYQAETHELNPSIPENVLPTNEITDILERCLEFVDDNTEDSISSYTAPAIYQPMDRESLQRRSIQEAQERLKKLERETALRREIEKALRILKGEK